MGLLGDFSRWVVLNLQAAILPLREHVGTFEEKFVFITGAMMLLASSG